jgi:hypothetical protein
MQTSILSQRFKLLWTNFHHKKPKFVGHQCFMSHGTKQPYSMKVEDVKFQPHQTKFKNHGVRDMMTKM